jgi:hypothetical protein
MSGRTVILSLLATLAPAALSAQATEIGMASGLSIFTAEDAETLTVFGVPGDFTFLPTAHVYVTTFATPNLAIEPQVGVVVASSDGETDWTTRLGAQVAYHTSGGSVSSPYFAANGAWVRDFGEDNNYILGASVGYRVILPPGLGLRFEAGYSRWFTGGDFDPPDFNQFRIGIGVGGLVGG